MGRESKAEGVEAGQEAKKLPTTSPNCLSNTLLDTLGAKKPAGFYLVEEVCREVPVLSASYLGEGGVEEEALEKYKLVNYDILGGEKYWVH